MDLAILQEMIQSQFRNDHSRCARVAHFVGLLKTGVEGMATMGVVLRIEAENLELKAALQPVPDVISSLEAAIAHVQGGSHATHQEGAEDQIRNG